MVKLNNKYVCLSLILIFLVVVSGYVFAQQAAANSTGEIRRQVDDKMERHQWEININIGPLLKLGTSSAWANPYLIKRNLGREAKYGALRFMVSPVSIHRRQVSENDTNGIWYDAKSSYFQPMASFGYERQIMKGRFMFYYGADIAWRLESDKFKDDNYRDAKNPNLPNGKLLIKSHQNSFWAAPLIGGKYYLNHRFTIGLESQLQFVYSKKVQQEVYKGVRTTQTRVNAFEILHYPYYMLNLSYNL
ncbi:hypothetical protein DSL64_05030 [Dyadobacter luteus]|uniref:DUF3575 domain-containing protein n=1 Tax=Dyadobacter luteus TaxID=2259619 RepID=A0A3D8YHA2_9BACT|nr:hypothetical protein [Dyadobacter luteus]REA63789.1 hypothetical protein DSL64_05030 [Dyadobacter luteus]